MFLSHLNVPQTRHKPHCWSFQSVTASLNVGVKNKIVTTEANTGDLSFEGTKERIRKLFSKVELSVSSYDTAWVAMVPSPHSSQAPCFPECVNWLLDNQLYDGSWGLLPQEHDCDHHQSLLKDYLSSTLASILALKRWGVGQEQINKGLHFMESNFVLATDNMNQQQHSPIGFDIIFPGMLEYAKDLDLNLPLEHAALNAMLHKRQMELPRCHEREAYLAYVSEGMGKLQDWEKVMKYQRKNGSLFNSPSTTAAALTHLQNVGCLNYLRSLLNKFGNAVPTIYPLDIYLHLSMVDNLERLGIAGHFRKEIQSVLDETYRSWLQGEEQIFLDVATCAVAFRVLRMNGYDVSSDPLTQITIEESYFDSLGGGSRDINAVLELYRASELIIYPDESANLGKLNSLSNRFLKQKLPIGSIDSYGLTNHIRQEVDEALKFPFYKNLERMANKRNIEHYNANSTRILKTSYCSSNISNKDFLKLAMEDFNICQSIHLEEFKDVQRWVTVNRLDKLKFAREKSAYNYFSAAATLFSPELSAARMSWTKNCVLTTIIDDFFDVAGSMEELVNLVQLVKKWNVNVDTDCCSEHVRILFSALHSTICEIGDQAFKWQARNVTSHLIEIWLDLLKAWFKEAKMVRDKLVPTMDEYLSTGRVTFALGPIVLPTLYLVGPKLSEEIVRSSEYNNLFTLMSNCGRLFNDIQSFKRESEEGKLNALSLHMIHGGGDITKEEATREIRSFIDHQRIELFRIVLQEKGNVVPRACKEVFWKMTKVVYQFYMDDDGFTNNDMMRAVKAILYEPFALK